ncbi:unnamed protein product [Paramecium pentaurelia]|uniref:Uncharacterized protein n=1 Tax=Paramecium pentaurelia TaxID=43138 RepID=A0A8S1YLC7_9CILI|nr:unnamed protein product [Paramecium pentaurelia]
MKLYEQPTKDNIMDATPNRIYKIDQLFKQSFDQFNPLHQAYVEFSLTKFNLQSLQQIFKWNIRNLTFQANINSQQIIMMIYFQDFA